MLTIGLVLSPAIASADDFVIAMLGDSLVQGYGLMPDQGLVPQLQRQLTDAGHPVRLINAGVSGDTTAGGRARLDWTLGPEVQALVVSLGANDLLRGLPVDEIRRNLAAILTEAARRDLPVLLIGFRATSNFGPDYKNAFDAIYPELAETHGVALMPSFFAPLRARDDGSVAMRARLLQPDGLHPTPAGVALVAEAMAPYLIALINTD